MDHPIIGKSFMAALIFAAVMMSSPAALHAQLVDELKAKIPFEFNADNTRLPAGDYFIRPAQEVGTSVLEIESTNNKIAVFVMTINTQTAQAPKTSKLLFDKIGSRYFLRGIVVQDSTMGYDIQQSKAEASLLKGSAKVDKHWLDVNHHGTKVSKS